METLNLYEQPRIYMVDLKNFHLIYTHVNKNINYLKELVNGKECNCTS